MEPRVKGMNATSLLSLAALLLLWNRNADMPVAAQRLDSLVMVANKSNTAASKMNKSDAKKLLLGQTSSWPDGGRIRIVLQNVGSAERAAVLQKVCGMNEAEYTRHNLQATFMGETVAFVTQADSAAAVRSLVKTNPGAVGFLRQSEVDDNVKAIWSVE
jgi:ABC-type phosphate transport system substrate-binding protein